MKYTSNPFEFAPYSSCIIPTLCNLFGKEDIKKAKITSLKNSGHHFNSLYGNDSTTSVRRIKLPSKSVILKQHTKKNRFRNEWCNYLFLNEISRGSVPRILALIDESLTIVLEDLGDHVPGNPSLRANYSIWKRVVNVIARIHSFAFGNIARLTKIYCGCPPKHKAQHINRLFDGISAALRIAGLLNSKLKATYLRELLLAIIRRLAWYRDEVAGFALSERSISNIRMVGDRIAFIDLVQPPIAIPHLDLISIWKSPYRKRLIYYYIKERHRLQSTFDEELFRMADYEFIILESLRWIAIRLRTLPGPTGIIGPVLERHQLATKIKGHCSRISEATLGLKRLDPEIATLANKVLLFDSLKRNLIP